MPIYEYVCEACGEVSEVMHRMSDPPATTCPKCHAEALVKQVSAAGFRLKGGGWYETDFKSDKKRNLVGDDPPVSKSAEGDAKTDAKAPAKPAEKTDSKPASKDAAPAAKPAAAPAPASTPSKSPSGS